MNNAGNQYLKQVKSHLPCPRALKKTFLEQLQGDVEEFLETNPDAPLEDLAERFGNPSEMAHAYIESLDGNELQKQMKKAKTVKRIVLFTCLGILSIILIVASIIIIDNLTADIAVVTYTVSEGETVITGVSEATKKEASTSDWEPNTSIVVEGTIQNVVDEIVEN